MRLCPIDWVVSFNVDRSRGKCVSYFHLCSTDLQPGAIINPGNWGRIIKKVGPSHGRWLAESCLEDVRHRQFPLLPSRLSCSYFFDDVSEATEYQKNNAYFLILYEVQLVDPSVPIHRADYRCVQPDNSLSLNWCQHYWQGLSAGPHPSGLSCTELLAVTPLRIIQKVPNVFSAQAF